MTTEEMLKEVQKTEPAKITAEIGIDNKIKVEAEGRNIELLTLALSIAESVINESDGFLTVDEYCNMLRDVFKQHSKSKEQRDVEKEIMKKDY